MLSGRWAIKAWWEWEGKHFILGAGFLGFVAMGGVSRGWYEIYEAFVILESAYFIVS